MKRHRHVELSRITLEYLASHMVALLEADTGLWASAKDVKECDFISGLVNREAERIRRRVRKP